jgi:intron-binding protein aquarius
VRSAALATQETPQKAWLLTVMLLVCHRLRRADSAEDIATAWAFVKEDADAWRLFMATLTSVSTATWTFREKATLVQFLIGCFSSSDVAVVDAECRTLVSLVMWKNALSQSQRALAFADNPKLARQWTKLSLDVDERNTEVDTEVKTPAKKKRKTDTPAKTPAEHEENTFMTRLLREFTEVLAKTNAKSLKEEEANEALQYLALVLTLLTDLLIVQWTRRVVEPVVRRKHIMAMLRQSPLVQYFLESRGASELSALTKQINRLEEAIHFPLETHTGKALTTVQDQKEARTRKIQALQQAAFGVDYRDTSIEALSIVPVAAIADRSQFKQQLDSIVQDDRQRLEALGVTLGVFSDEGEAQVLSTATLTDCFLDEYSASSRSTVASGVVLPTELELWSESLAMVEENDTESLTYGTGPSILFPVLPIPKLGLQYLNVTDVLERNAELSLLGAAHAVRRDLEAAIRPLDAVRSLARNGETVFRGFAPTAVPLATALSIMKVEKPRIGEAAPATVVAQFDVELDTRHDISAFDRYHHRELVYLVTIRPTRDEASEAIGFQDENMDGSGHFAEDYGVLYIRCAYLTSMEDDTGKQVKPSSYDSESAGKGRTRALHVELDGAQYKKDLEAGQLGAYEYVNLLVRRDPRTSNFKATLDALSSTLQSSTCEQPGAAVPAWLYDLYVGYGDALSASYEEIAKSRLQAAVQIPLHHALGNDAAHAVSCCSTDGSHHVHLVDGDHDDKALAPKDAVGPFTLVTDVASKTSVLRAHRKAAKGDKESAVLETQPRLTKEQAQVIIRGTGEGLTLATGAVGTGKSEALARLIQNLCQGTTQTANDKILVIGRSTAALDKLLDRLKAVPFVDEATLARLGAPRVDGDDFSAQGRVDFLLQRRIDRLQEVEYMAKWMERADAAKYAGISGSASYSCENALFFYRFYMKALLDEAKEATTLQDVLLSQYFAERTGAEATSLSELHTFVSRLEGIYGELHRLQPFELLQLPAQRRDVYLMQHARVVAMTSHQAALQFQKLVDLKLQWTSVVIDDAAQLSEVDAIIPLTLACRSNALRKHKLKRLVMVGDSTQHAPVEIPSLKSYARCHTSLFERLLRLGAPSIQLSALTPTKPHAPPPPSSKTKPPPPPKKASTKK